jgi:hypothetical protein
MLSINSVKNVNIENVKFSANQLVLLKVKESVTRDGSVNVTTNYIEVCSLKDTKDITLITSLLKHCLAEFKVASEIEDTFKAANITQRKVINPFLNTKVLFRTDSEGKISKALRSEVNFKDTALKLKASHTLTKCDKNTLRAAIYTHAKAILTQCSYLSMIGKKVEELLPVLESDAKMTKSEKKIKVA